MSEAPFTRKPRRGIFRDSQKSTKIYEELSIVTQVGLTMAGCIGFCFWIGYKLDAWLQTHGIVLVIFILMGIAGGGWTVYRQIQDLYKSDKKR